MRGRERERHASVCSTCRYPRRTMGDTHRNSALLSTLALFSGRLIHCATAARLRLLPMLRTLAVSLLSAGAAAGGAAAGEFKTLWAVAARYESLRWLSMDADMSDASLADAAASACRLLLPASSAMKEEQKKRTKWLF